MRVLGAHRLSHARVRRADLPLEAAVKVGDARVRELDLAGELDLQSASPNGPPPLEASNASAGRTARAILLSRFAARSRAVSAPSESSATPSEQHAASSSVPAPLPRRHSEITRSRCSEANQPSAVHELSSFCLLARGLAADPLLAPYYGALTVL